MHRFCYHKGLPEATDTARGRRAIKGNTHDSGAYVCTYPTVSP